MSCQQLLAKYPGFVPAIIKCDQSIEMTKKRFLLPRNECWSYALSSIRKHIVLKPSEAVFFMVDGIILESFYNLQVTLRISIPNIVRVKNQMIDFW